MSPLLYLAHRLPFPPNKGDKIRSFHLMKALSSRYRLSVGAFIDAPEDRQHLPALREMCEEVCVPEISPRYRRIRSAGALLTGDPLTEAYYQHRVLARWVERTIVERGIERVVMFSSSMGQFIPPALASRLRCVIDFCDLDSDKWRQYAGRRPWPLSALYAREARRLEQTEIELARRFQATLFVSPLEASTFCERAPELASRVQVVRNGVDVSYFDPADYPLHSERAANDAKPARQEIVFTGAMDYWANVEGVCWFVREVWPRVRARCPEAHFVIVGARPVRAVRKLESSPGVSVTGGVPDVRPFLSRAWIAVAPLRIARGVQNKVLEAMAMGRPVVATPAALQGIDSPLPDGVHTAPSAEQFAAAVAALLEEGATFSSTNRQYVLDRYDWPRSLAHFLDLVAGDGSLAPTVAAA